MITFTTHTGVGSQVEIWGVRGNYIYLMIALITFLFLTSVLLSNTGVPILLIVLFLIVAGTSSYWGVIRLYKRFGVHGMTKYTAMKKLPRQIKNPSGIKPLIIKR